MSENAAEETETQPVRTEGLRDRQKRKRQACILDAASALFRRKSFDETTVEEIAEHAEVSPGTVFNYYGTKVNILLSLIEIENRKILAAAFEPQSRARGKEDVCGFLESIAAESLSLVPPAAWCHVYSTLITDRGSEFAGRFRKLQEELVRAIAGLIGEGEGAASEIDPLVIGRCIHRIHNAAFVELVAAERPDFDRYLADVDLHVGAVMKLIGRA
ncbi:TetR/AcrR family transcriptional regulator [Methyloligella sp. 2.7D]|uniref:TetR/AcrR family transcriptional regulator n=1 Tax=unclassified Methyloligella TaxID=2625955 RepID=UPI00157CB044|nr:TetR/AcrR family transcriptional regulator [Methyloligella sp. GL2]QKP77924.1 TetR/AcrR family transcriptional regulator [Methyloligella sp. GL2]